MATPFPNDNRAKLNAQQRDHLNDLIHLELDAIEAYDAAIGRVAVLDYRRHLLEFKGDHERHVRELSALVTAAGGEPATKADIKRFLTTGKVVIGDLTGDIGVLKAMTSNEKVTNAKYDEALESPLFASSPAVRAVLSRNRDDERRHKAWIDMALAQLGE